MKLVDKLVEVSKNPLSPNNRFIAKAVPIFVFFIFFPVLFFILPNFVLDSWLNLPKLFSTSTRILLGGAMILLGVFFLLWTLKAQKEIGKGTPMPLMATQKLVIQAPYSFTRNPLAFGLINFYFGISIAIGSISSSIIILVFSTLILVYIRNIEEKELEQRYGADYAAYKKVTPFLMPQRSNKIKGKYISSANTYDPMLYFAINPIRLAVMKELSQYKDSKILDLCCGTGNQLKLLSKNGFKNLHCLDLSEAMLKVAEKGGHPIKIYTEDATNTSFDDAEFDIIMISFAIHEKNRETQEKLIEEAHRLIKKEGFILIVDFAFDEKTTKLGKMGIDLIERLAGGEHYLNFKGYIENDGLDSLLKADKFELTKDMRRTFNGVTISTYQKI